MRMKTLLDTKRAEIWQGRMSFKGLWHPSALNDYFLKLFEKQSPAVHTPLSDMYPGFCLLAPR